MPNVHDLAHQLAKALKSSPEYVGLLQAKQKINTEETSKKMFEHLQQVQMELQMKQMQGQNPTQEELENYQKLFADVQLNPTISQYLHAEKRFAVMMEDINKIMGEPLQELYPPRP